MKVVKAGFKTDHLENDQKYRDPDRQTCNLNNGLFLISDGLAEGDPENIPAHRIDLELFDQIECQRRNNLYFNCLQKYLAGASFTFNTSAVQCRPPGGLLQPSGETVGTSYLGLTEEDDGEEVDEETEGVGAVCLPVNTGFAHVVLHVVSGHWIY